MSIDHEASLTGRSRDTPEVVAIDVRSGNGEIRAVQDIHGVKPKFKFLGFRNLHSLDQVGVEPDVPRPFEPFQAHVTDLSRRRIYKEKITLSICYCLVAECT